MGAVNTVVVQDGIADRPQYRPRAALPRLSPKTGCRLMAPSRSSARAASARRSALRFATPASRACGSSTSKLDKAARLAELLGARARVEISAASRRRSRARSASSTARRSACCPSATRRSRPICCGRRTGWPTRSIPPLWTPLLKAAHKRGRDDDDRAANSRWPGDRRLPTVHRARAPGRGAGRRLSIKSSAERAKRSAGRLMSRRRNQIRVCATGRKNQ